MKIDEVPQQPNEMYEGETKAVYAVNSQGKLEMTQSTGWDAETLVLESALQEVNRLTEEALERVWARQTSLLEYYMYRQRMDLPMLAKMLGSFKWQVRRNFNPRRFNKLNNRKLNFYAEVLGISVVELTSTPEKS